MAEPAQTANLRPRKKRPPPKRAEVIQVERIVPRLTRVTFGGGDMAAFSMPKPGAHIKLLFPEPGSTWSPADTDAPRPPSRTYTPRRFDADTHELDVEVVHHGDGLAANWVRTAKPGDELFIGGPGGGLDIPDGTTHAVLLADETAMPAAGMIIEALPEGCEAAVFCEVADADDERRLSAIRGVSPTWLHRAETGAVQGSLLEHAATTLGDMPETTLWWIACEAGAMRRVRKHLMDDRGVEKAWMNTRGYWRLGETNYPDHDYGED